MRRLVALAVAALLAMGLVGFGVQRAAAAPLAAQASSASSEVCLLIVILCFPTSGSSPSASPTPTATASASATPGATAPAAASSDAASPDAASPGAASPTASSVASPTAGSTASPSGSPSPAATAQPKGASAASGLEVSSVTWTMTVSSATMTGFTYKGTVDLPKAGGGSVEMMEFTVSSMSLSGADTQIMENGVTATETDGAFTASGVTMYATSLSATLLGVPVSFTPSTLTVANLLKLPNAGELQLTNLITSNVTLPMTDITADQAVILAGTAQKTTVGVSER